MPRTSRLAAALAVSLLSSQLPAAPPSATPAGSGGPSAADRSPVLDRAGDMLDRARDRAGDVLDRAEELTDGGALDRAGDALDRTGDGLDLARDRAGDVLDRAEELVDGAALDRASDGLDRARDRAGDALDRADAARGAIRLPSPLDRAGAALERLEELMDDIGAGRVPPTDRLLDRGPRDRSLDRLGRTDTPGAADDVTDRRRPGGFLERLFEREHESSIEETSGIMADDDLRAPQFERGGPPEFVRKRRPEWTPDDPTVYAVEVEEEMEETVEREVPIDTVRGLAGPPFDREPFRLSLADRLLAQRLARIDHLRDVAMENGNMRLLEQADQLEELARSQHARRLADFSVPGEAALPDEAPLTDPTDPLTAPASPDIPDLTDPIDTTPTEPAPGTGAGLNGMTDRAGLVEPILPDGTAPTSEPFPGR